MRFGDTGVPTEVGAYCRWYRMFVADVPLRMIAGEEQVKNVSGFEHGRSTNQKYLLEYIRLADKRGELELFMRGLLEDVIYNDWREEF